MILFVLPLTLFQKFLAVIHLECLCQQLEVVRCTQDALDSLIFSKQRSRLLQLWEHRRQTQSGNNLSVKFSGLMDSLAKNDQNQPLEYNSKDLHWMAEAFAQGSEEIALRELEKYISRVQEGP